MRIPLLVLVAITACATDPEPGTDDGAPLPDEPVITDPTDADEDGIPEELETYLMAHFGPELRLPPDDIDWTRPANVDWYLPRVKLRFDHPGCPDDGDNLRDAGAITFDNLSTPTHYTKSGGTGLCRHNDGESDKRYANKKALEFFLQAQDDDAVHPGIPVARQDEWRAYIQVRASEYPGSAYDLQVWYFFAYNDNIASANHEADWEHLTVSVSADYHVVSVFFATHDAGDRFDDLSTLEWSGTHVVAYVADGSHASYPSPGAHPGPAVDDHAYAGGPRWETWQNFANLGQVGHILDGQTWAAYGGRWGEVGETEFTSGPPGPMFQGKWTTKNEY